MPTSARWYPRKTPTLQIEILKIIATGEPKSKNMLKKATGSHYPDVSDAVEKLVKRRLICAVDIAHRGNTRDKRFFRLTYKGLQVFIDGKPSPTEFWKAIHWFCKLSKRKIDWNTFDTLYRRFQYIYLGYTPLHGHFFQFRFIDILFKKWLKDNDKIYDQARDNIIKGVVLSQRVLECLGMNRLVTLEQLHQRIEEQTSVFNRGRKITKNVLFFYSGHSIDSSEEGIKSALEEFSLSANYRGLYHSHRPDVRYELDQILNQYVDFIQHLVVVPHLEKGETRYELSLFGIALLLSVRAYEFLNPERVFYNDLEFGEFCSRLSTNYRDKLPLIFGKWDSLIRETLGDNHAIFEILRNLFYDHTSKAMIESSVILGGVKEYYESIKTLSDWSYPRLEAIHKAGEKILEELGQSNDCYCDKLLFSKMEEISNSLSQRNLNRFTEGLRTDGGPNSPIRDPHRIYVNELVYIEKALADEISFLFYIFFYVRHLFDRDRFEPIYSTYFPAMFKPAYWTRTVHLENGVPMFEYREEIKTEDAYPLQSFVNIIRKHKDVRQLLANWIDDATKCQNDVQSKISGLGTILDQKI